VPEDHSVAQMETERQFLLREICSLPAGRDIMKAENTGRRADDTGEEVIVKRKVNSFYNLLLIYM